MAYPNVANQGMFLPTSFPVVTDDLKEMMIRLYQDLTFICNTINLKETAYYTLDEFVTGQLFFPNPALNSTTPQTPVFRQAFRKLINFGTLPNAATKSVAHGLAFDSTYTFTKIYATATDPVGLVAFPIPITGTTITVDATNVNITTTANMTAYTACFCILEFIKQ
jgi:hypothetical protein